MGLKGFQPGNQLSKGKGKPKGSRSTRTFEAIAIIEGEKYDPLRAMISTYNIAMERYYEYAKRFDENRISPMEDNSASFLKIGAQMAKELAAFAYPKLKSMEQNINIGIEVDLAKKIEERKAALLKMLEDKPEELEVVSQVNGPGPTG